jgi:glycine/D-amino acid oxidase-like deaminating enzyme
VSLLGFLRRGSKGVSDVTVLGSGLPAQVVALELARRRRRVTVIEPAPAEAEEETDEPPANLGLVALGPGRPYEYFASALGRDGARAVWSAGRENQERLRTFLEEARRDCGYQARGSFLLAADREEATSLANSEDMLRDDEFPGEFLDHYMLETHFDVSGFAGAYWAADDAELDGGELVATVHAAARATGVVFRSVPVRGLEVGPSEAVVETAEGPLRTGFAVVANDGVASVLWPDLGRGLRPAASARLRFVPEAGASLPTVARTADGRLAWQRQPAGITLAATGEAEAPAGGEPGESSRLEAMAVRLHATPGSERGWVETAEASPDGLPIAGVVEGRALAVACGFGPLAASLVFAAAGWVADAILLGRDPTPEPFRVGREPGRVRGARPV